MERKSKNSHGSGSTGPFCHQCDKSDTETRLHKCPICFKHFCEEHTHLWSGRPFCSSGCAEYFYFGGEDED